MTVWDVWLHKPVGDNYVLQSVSVRVQYTLLETHQIKFYTFKQMDSNRIDTLNDYI